MTAGDTNELTTALSRRALEAPVPETTAMSQKVRDLRAQGIEVVNLTIGEPDFDTPEPIRAAGKAALDANETRYTPFAGLPDLRQAITDKLARENGLDYGADEIVVTNGVKQALTNACLALLEEGDEVVLPAPYWPAYPGIVEFCGGTVVPVTAGVEDAFKVTPEALAVVMSERTKLVLFNSPSNPTGSVYSREELEGLVKTVLAHPRAWFLSDEIYERIVFSGEHCSIAAIPGARERTITLNGVSKSFAMTGWRVGYMAMPAPLAPYLARVQGMLTAGVNPAVQIAAAYALRHGTQETERMRQAYRARRDLVYAALKEIPGFKVNRPDGAFYAFVDVSARFTDEVSGSAAFTGYLLDKARVAVVAGASFGDDNCIRLSTGASEDVLKEGVARIRKAVEALR